MNIPDKMNDGHNPLIYFKNVISLPLHIALEGMKHFVKAIDKNGSAFLLKEFHLRFYFPQSHQKHF